MFPLLIFCGGHKKGVPLNFLGRLFVPTKPGGRSGGGPFVCLSLRLKRESYKERKRERERDRRREKWPLPLSPPPPSLSLSLSVPSEIRSVGISHLPFRARTERRARAECAEPSFFLSAAG